jgi:hypothetical protein
MDNHGVEELFDSVPRMPKKVNPRVEKYFPPAKLHKIRIPYKIKSF